MNDTEALKKLIRHVPDFPKPGILFYDITTLLQDSAGFRQAVECVANPYQGTAVDVVVGTVSACHGAIDLIHVPAESDSAGTSVR